MLFISYYLRAIGAITLFLGLSLLFLPGFVGSLLFEEVNSAVKFFVSITGSTLIGYSVLNILAGARKNHHLQELAVWGNLSTLLIATLVTIIYYGRFDSLGWLVLGEHIVFATGFIICAVKLKAS